VDPAAPGADYRISLPEFEGPLDLLLHLVKRHELNIFDIPISFITKKYLEYLELMRSLNLDVAGEYLLMAATLAYIKSREILPRQEAELEQGEEEGEDPREELVRRLLIYQKYRDAGEVLGRRPLLGRQVFGRGARVGLAAGEELPLVEVSTFALVESLAEVLKRTEVKGMHDVMVDRISITDRINSIVDQLKESETVRFLDCFQRTGGTAQLRHDLVVTFLAILEMTRLQMIRLLQHTDNGEIYLTRTADLHSLEADAVEDYG
jgi:segregation and condensation protein A